MNGQIGPESTLVDAARHRRRFPIRAVAALAIVGVAAGILVASGTLDDTSTTLQVMGFDPDRSMLIASLVVEAIVVALAVLVTAAPVASVAGGMVTGLAVFGRTFDHETRAALASSGATGVFDPAGWLVTVVTLGTVVLVVGWAAAALTLIVRRQLLVAGADVVAVLHGERRSTRLGRPLGVLVALAVLAVALPVFGDMVNFGPDVHMLTGAAQTSTGLAQSSGSALPSSLPTLPPQVLDTPGLLAPGTASAGGAAGAVLSSRRPWVAWTPSGQGSITQVSFPGPWVGGMTATAGVSVYTPPGYASGSRRYPVVYEVPWGIRGWQTSGQLPSALDALINAGSIPAEIVVFVNDRGGPYPDSECTNSLDHREWVDTYLTQTLVPYVDAHYRTIAEPAARAVMGFSQGGFCASMLVLRHPDLFASAIAFSGYYQAGLRSNQTPNAYRPFGGNPAYEAAWSPLALVPQVATATRQDLFFELSANPHESIYGPQYDAFAALLHQASIPVALFPTPLGHAWAATRAQIPAMLETLAARETALNVFG